MSADNRTVHTDDLATLGTIIDDTQKRDAIHLAVLPMKAPCVLHAGTHVDAEGRPVMPYSSHAVGIVDPFLREIVHTGDHFWLVIYPRVITSLRHVWAHPAFADEVTTANAASAPIAQDDVARSRAWIENFCARIPLAYDVVMDGARDYVYDREAGGYGEYLVFGGLLEGESVPDEFWPHFEVVTGTTVDAEHRGSFFSCSC